MGHRIIGRAVGRPARAFTLIELVVVMALMVVLAGISYPLLQRWMEEPLHRGARQMRAVIERLHERTVMTRQIYRLRLDLPGDRYWAEVLQRNEEERTEEFVAVPPEHRLPANVRVKDLVTPQRETVTEGEVAVYFYPIGRLDQVVIHLERGDGRKMEEMSLVPHPLTGQVSITKGRVQ